MDRECFESHVLTLSEFGPFAEGLETVAGLHRFHSVPLLSMIWPAGLIRRIREIAPDVVHTHSGVWYKASLAARHAGVPRLVHTDHGRPHPDPWRARLLDGCAARRTDVVVAVSEALRDRMAATVVRDGSRIRVVVNGVDTEWFRTRSAAHAVRQELHVPTGAPVIGSIGRLDPVKAYDVMLQAFALLRTRWPDGPSPILLLVGDGPERARLAALVQTYGLQEVVHLAGWRKDVECIYPLFDLFTLSSWSEGTSLVLLEAMSSGLCPVVTDVGGCAAVLGERLRHRLVRPGDPAALAEAWRDALAHPEQRCVDGLVARARVEQAFGLDTMVRQYERIYADEP
jgi:glycosyltransferase involved in cell wall biosynthesis